MVKGIEWFAIGCIATVSFWGLWGMSWGMSQSEVMEKCLRYGVVEIHRRYFECREVPKIGN